MLKQEFEGRYNLVKIMSVKGRGYNLVMVIRIEKVDS